MFDVAVHMPSSSPHPRQLHLLSRRGSPQVGDNMGIPLPPHSRFSGMSKFKATDAARWDRPSERSTTSARGGWVGGLHGMGELSHASNRRHHQHTTRQVSLRRCQACHAEPTCKPRLWSVRLRGGEAPSCRWGEVTANCNRFLFHGVLLFSGFPSWGFYPVYLDHQRDLPASFHSPGIYTHFDRRCTVYLPSSTSAGRL